MKIVLKLLEEHKEFHRRQAEWDRSDDRLQFDGVEKIIAEHKACQEEFEEAISILKTSQLISAETT